MKTDRIETAIVGAERYIEEINAEINRISRANPHKHHNFGSLWDIQRYPVLRALVSLGCKVSTEQVYRDLKAEEYPTWQDYIRHTAKQQGVK